MVIGKAHGAPRTFLLCRKVATVATTRADTTPKDVRMKEIVIDSDVDIK